MAQDALIAQAGIPFYNLKSNVHWLYGFIELGFPGYVVQLPPIDSPNLVVSEILQELDPHREKAFAVLPSGELLDLESNSQRLENAFKMLEARIHSKFRELRKNDDLEALKSYSLKNIMIDAFSGLSDEFDNQLEDFIKVLACKIIFEENYGVRASHGGYIDHLNRDRFFDRLQRLSESLGQARLCERSFRLLNSRLDREQALYEAAVYYEWPTNRDIENGNAGLEKFPKGQSNEDRQAILQQSHDSYFEHRAKWSEPSQINARNQEWVTKFRDTLQKAFDAGVDKSLWELIYGNWTKDIDAFVTTDLWHSILENPLPCLQLEPNTQTSSLIEASSIERVTKDWQLAHLQVPQLWTKGGNEGVIKAVIELCWCRTFENCSTQDEWQVIAKTEIGKAWENRHTNAYQLPEIKEWVIRNKAQIQDQLVYSTGRSLLEMLGQSRDWPGVFTDSGDYPATLLYQVLIAELIAKPLKAPTQDLESPILPDLSGKTAPKTPEQPEQEASKLVGYYNVTLAIYEKAHGAMEKVLIVQEKDGSAQGEAENIQWLKAGGYENLLAFLGKSSDSQVQPTLKATEAVEECREEKYPFVTIGKDYEGKFVLVDGVRLYDGVSGPSKTLLWVAEFCKAAKNRGSQYKEFLKPRGFNSKNVEKINAEYRKKLGRTGQLIKTTPKTVLPLFDI